MFWLMVIVLILVAGGIIALVATKIAERRGTLGRVESADYEAHRKGLDHIETLAYDEARLANSPFADIILDEVRTVRDAVRANHSKELS